MRYKRMIAPGLDKSRGGYTIPGMYSDTLRTFEKRNRRIRRLRSLGWSYGRLAKHFGISRGRAHQICSMPAR
jgi:hypothetical protein